ncbi:MAG TPA: MXAN_5187 C-terminal domain-containing protein [Polyangia bacterium]|nr:MXAN_5187 C-terminal domain-containing protein [Polyangia bacterium]
MASRSQTEQQTQAQDIGELLADLAIKIDRLKTLYEQYFMGIEKMEPQVARKEVTRAMLLLQQQYIRNTALRFKFNTMLQKWNIYITYWNRILREIENGTYTRHLAKARRKAEQQGRELPQEIALAAAKKNLLQSGTFDAVEDTSESGPRRFLDNETGAHNAYSGSADDEELEQVWDRITGADPKRRPPPTPPPGTLAAMLPATLTGRDKMLAELAAAKAKAQADLEARRAAVPQPIGKQDSGATPRLPPPPPVSQLNRAGNSVPIAIDKDKSGPIPRVALPPPPPPPAAMGQARAAAPPPRLPPPAPLALPKIPGMNEPELRALHQRYVDAQKQSGAGAGVKYETLVNSLAKQVPSVLKQPGVKGVRFDVSVMDGKPILKAIPQK